ncbi:hypothetical protein JCM11491_000032 [Sporobolomyces phaffii]
MTSLQAKPRPPLDRLSLLPNELLDAIFGLSYSSLIPTAPLSKRLRPFQERQLYRSIVLKTVDQFHALSRTLHLNSTRGQFVLNLGIAWLPFYGDDTSNLSLDDLLSKIPNLVTLILPVGPGYYSTPNAEVMARLLAVRSVTVTRFEPTAADSSRFELSDFAFLSELPNLNELDVLDWPQSATGSVQYSKAFSFARVQTLGVTGVEADEATILQIVNLCPSLLHLYLLACHDVLIEFPGLPPYLPATLRSLSLLAPNASFAACDSLLLRFSHLRILDLGAVSHSRSIHTTLAQLPNLVSIRLGDGQVDYRGFAALVSGPSRLVDLRSITLNSAYSSINLFGTYTPAPSDPSFSADAAFWPDDMSDWVHPSEYLPDPVGLRTLRGVCHSNGVRLSGTMFKCLEALEEFRIESNNRAVLSAVFGRHLSPLRQVRAAAMRDQVPLPSDDLDSLDPDHLEVVETELPETYRLVLSLRNKARSEKVGQEQGHDD